MSNVFAVSYNLHARPPDLLKESRASSCCKPLLIEKIYGNAGTKH